MVLGYSRGCPEFIKQLYIWWDSTITIYGRVLQSNIDFENDNIVRLVSDVLG